MARFAAFLQRVELLPGPDERLEKRADAWYREVSAIFMEAYRRAMAGCPSLPADDAVANDLIRLFMMEKACYEICYEAPNRPGWPWVPVLGMSALLDKGGDAPWLL